MTARLAPRAVWPSEPHRCRWIDLHAEHLRRARTVPQLRAEWDAACLGMKGEGWRLRKAELAWDLAFHDAGMLADDWPDHASFVADLDACEARVRAVGTPIRWAGDPEPDPDGPCPLAPGGEHLWSVRGPLCRYCATDMAPAAVGPVLAERGYGAHALATVAAIRTGSAS